MSGNEKLLLTALRNRQEKALEEIYGTYWKSLYIYAFGFMGDHPRAQDLVQEVFISLWERSAETEIVHIEAYLFRSVKYSAINLLKKDQRTLPLNDHIGLHHHHESTEDHFNYMESEELFQKTMGKLPGKCRKVFYLSRVLGYNNKEIAKEMNISIRTVETHISNALSTFRLHFKLMVILFLGFLSP